MKIAVYPGSFDPITNGHLDILSRASALFDKIIISVVTNPAKSPLLCVEERVKLIGESVKSMKNVEVGSFESLTVLYAKQQRASAIIRGLRAVSDFEKELQMAQANKSICSSIEMVFLMSSLEYVFLSSSLVKEICFLGGDISGLVPDCVKQYLNKLREMRFTNDSK